MRSVSILSTVLTVVLTLSCFSYASSRKVSRPSSGVAAPSRGSEVPELISFKEFQNLDKNQKLYYLTQVRNLVSMISASGGWESAENKNKWQILIEQMIASEANAKIGKPLGHSAPIRCPEGQILQRGWFSSSCVKDPTKCPRNQVAVYATDGSTLSCQLVTNSANTCPSGYARQESQNNTGVMVSYCLPADNNSAADISKHFQSEIMPDKGADNAKPNDGEKSAGTADAPKSTVPKADESAPKVSSTKCWWDEMQKCESSSAKRKEIAKQWYKSKPANGELACIYGGNVSGYKNPDQPKAGDCKAVREAKFGEKIFSCSAGQTLCSPLVFGVEDYSAGKGHCVRGKNATQECASRSNPTTVVGQIASMGPSASFEWDRLKEGLKNLVASCIVEDKEKNQILISPNSFQCQECQIIANRVIEMRRALNSKMAELSCDLQAQGSIASTLGSNPVEPSLPVKGTR